MVTSGSPSATRCPTCACTAVTRPSTGAPTSDTAPSRKATSPGAWIRVSTASAPTSSTTTKGIDSARMRSAPPSTAVAVWGRKSGACASAPSPQPAAAIPSVATRAAW